MDKSSLQFEEWFKKEYPLIEAQPENTLLQSVKRQCQKAWQASRKSLVVELPYINTDPDYSDPYTDGKDDGILEVAAVLNELGVTIE